MSRTPRMALIAGLAALFTTVSGCGQATDGDRVLSGATDNKPLSGEDQLIERKLVTDKDAREAPAGSAERAFLEYWTAVSFEDWATAVRYVDTSLRRILDVNYLVEALRIEGQNNVPVKPIIRDAARTRGSVSIRYLIRTSDGRLRPTSSSWEQRNGVWYMVYSSTLDDSYAAAVQQAVQNDVDPTATTPSRKAISAGSSARRAQSEALRPPSSPAAKATPQGQAERPEAPAATPAADGD